jgi:hypothetical protein
MEYPDLATCFAAGHNVCYVVDGRPDADGHAAPDADPAADAAAPEGRGAVRNDGASGRGVRVARADDAAPDRGAAVRLPHPRRQVRVEGEVT